LNRGANIKMRLVVHHKPSLSRAELLFIDFFSNVSSLECLSSQYFASVDDILSIKDR
jgi:hypothetical protein